MNVYQPNRSTKHLDKAVWRLARNSPFRCAEHWMWH